MTIWLMRIACWILKSTDTHPEYVILIAFPLQQWLQKRSLIFCCTYIAVLIINTSNSTFNSSQFCNNRPSDK